MLNKLYILFSVCALSFLSACTEEKQQNTQTGATTKVNTTQASGQSSLEQTTEAVTKTLQQQKSQLDQSINDINKTLTEMNSTYEKEFKVNQDQINQLAGQLGALARQAGEGARMLETTTQTLGQAIQQGFEEGYNKAKTAEQNQGNQK